jgi:pyruvate dehydrogenase E1 component alpha subunit
LECQIDHISVLDAEGTLDEELEPDLPEALLSRLHRTMLQARRFDERMLSLQRQGRLGTFAPVQGQEAAQLGTICQLRDDDWMVPSYREIAAMLWRGASMSAVLVANAGYNEGGAMDEGQKDLPIAVPVGTQMLHAAGLGYGLRRQGAGGIVMTFFGDGATSEGDFHEAMNFASVYDSPTIFVCENNRYAISTPRAKQTASETLAQKAIAYGMPGVQVDGNDVLAVFVAAQEAAQRAREKSRPSMIECLTYRLGVHTTVDDPRKYRDEAEEKRWKKRDPLPRFQRYLKDKELLDDEQLEALEEEIEQEIAEAVTEMDRTIESLPGPEMMFDHLLAEEPPYLQRQRRWLEEQS